MNNLSTSAPSTSNVVMRTSEELSQINSALTHCTQLKTQLHSTLLHIQHLNSKYNHTDYMAVIRNLENYRRTSNLTSSPYPKQRPRDEFTDDVELEHSCSTPKMKRSKIFRRLNGNGGLTSTPKQSKLSQLADSFDSSYNSDFETPKRSVREVKNKINKISVCKIKVQRNIEAIITHLQVMQRSQLKRRQQQLEQSLYQSCCNLSCDSFGSMGHTPRMEFSNCSYRTAYDSTDSLNNHSKYHTPNKVNTSMQYDADQKTLDRVQRFYATPLQRMHKRLIHLNASLVSTC